MALFIRSTVPQNCMLPVIPIRIASLNGSSLTSFALLDIGATTSFIDRKVAELTGMEVVNRTLIITTLLKNEVEVTIGKTGCIVSAIMPGYNTIIHIDDINVHDNMQFNAQLPDITMMQWPHFQHLSKDLDYPTVDLHKISFIFGVNLPQVHYRQSQCWGKPNSKEPFAMETPFGWCVAGPRTTPMNQDLAFVIEELQQINPPVSLQKPLYDKRNSPYATDPDNDLYTQLAHFWSLEGQGFSQANSKVYQTPDDQRASDLLLQKTVLLADSHYQSPLLWRHDNVRLFNNYGQALSCLVGLHRRFQRNPGKEEEYRSIIEGYVQKGFVRKLLPDELVDGPRTNYLPHHYVVNPNKSKIRVVFNGAAKYKGVSLNSQLLEGPNKTNHLSGILMRLRQDNIAFSCDIETMFYQIWVTPEDTDSLRFLWHKKGCEHQPPDIYKMLVHVFGKKDSPCVSANALQQTALDNKDNFPEAVIQTILRHFYVDDGMKSVRTVQEAFHLAQGLIACLAKGGFRLTKFLSNSRELINLLPHTELADPAVNLDLDKLPIARALGVQWDTQTDTLGVKIIPNQAHPPATTKRTCLSLTYSIFDPLGIIAPVFLIGKRFIRELSMSLPADSWDTPLSPLFLDRWQEWCDQLPLLSNIKIPRAYFPLRSDTETIELHACETGYGVIAYFRQLLQCHIPGTNTAAATWTLEDRYITDSNVTLDINVAFIIAKTRTTHHKFISITRKGLQSCVLATRVAQNILHEADITVNVTHYWSDSRTSLQYIANQEKRYPTFILNRVHEICETSTPSQWHHIKGKDNPADMASRGAFPKKFLEDSPLWLHGPDFLRSQDKQWTDAAHQYTGKQLDSDLEIKSERKANSKSPHDDVTPNFPNDSDKLHAVQIMTIINNKPPIEKTLLDKLMEYHSELTNLLTSVAWLMRFKVWYLEGFRTRQTNRCSDSVKLSSTTTCNDKSKSPHVIPKGSLKTIPQRIQDRPSVLHSSELQGALLQLVARAQTVSFPIEYAILERNGNLPQSSRLIQLTPYMDQQKVIRMSSRIVHAAIEHDTKYPIILLNSHILSKTIVWYTHVKHLHGGRDLTLSQIRKRFWIIGGPSLVKSVLHNCQICRKNNPVKLNQIMAPLPIDRITAFEPVFTYTGLDYMGPVRVQRARSPLKRWIVIFTCLCSRAATFDIAENLTAGAFINAYRRFICAYGNVKLLRSDNGSNFIGAERELTEAMAGWNSKLINNAIGPDAKWEFQDPLAPHTSGVWERLNRITKNCMRAVIKERLVSEDVLRTVLAEAARVMNSRPLCKLTDDPTSDEALTPNDLLLHRAASPCPGDFNPTDMYCRRTWQQAQGLAAHFQERWVSEYLPTLCERQRWFFKRRDLKVGDLVLVMNDTKSRKTWVTGVVDSVNVGIDGHVRSAQIRCSGSILTRNITKLSLLEEATFTDKPNK